jgi:hypothetical protein
MSVATLTTVSFNFYSFAGPAATTPSTDRAPPRDLNAVAREHGEDGRKRFRESTLVGAIMAAFQALGLGGTTSTPTTGATTPPTSGTASPSASDAVTGTASTATGTGTVPAPDTLEKAVNEFAHTLSAALHRPNRSAQADGEHEGAQGHTHEGRGKAGYSGLAQRLEQLAQSLGVAPSAANTTAAATPATADTAPVASVPSADTSRLLAAFAKVIRFLQPASTTADPSTETSTGTGASGSSIAEKLKLFLTTLAHSLRAGGPVTPLSPVGSRVNLTA